MRTAGWFLESRGALLQKIHREGVSLDVGRWIKTIRCRLDHCYPEQVFHRGPWIRNQWCGRSSTESPIRTVRSRSKGHDESQRRGTLTSNPSRSSPNRRQQSSPPNPDGERGGTELWHGGAIAARSDHMQSSPKLRFNGYTRGGGHGKLGVGIVTSISATQKSTHGARRSPELRREIVVHPVVISLYGGSRQHHGGTAKFPAQARQSRRGVYVDSIAAAETLVCNLTAYSTAETRGAGEKRRARRGSRGLGPHLKPARGGFVRQRSRSTRAEFVARVISAEGKDLTARSRVSSMERRRRPRERVAGEADRWARVTVLRNWLTE
jgi:hypothetical protein